MVYTVQTITNMTYVSNDPSNWPYLEWSRRYNYFIGSSHDVGDISLSLTVVS